MEPSAAGDDGRLPPGDAALIERLRLTEERLRRMGDGETVARDDPPAVPAASTS